MSFEPNNNDDGRLPEYRQMPEEPVQAAPLPYYSMLMTAALAIVFVMQLNAGLVDSLREVAFDKRSFLDGHRMWTILTSLVTHHDLMHIFFNAYAMFSFGRLLEVLSNRGHIPTIFLLSGLAGNALSLMLNPNVASIGASGGIIGLLGYTAVYAIKRKQFLDPAFRRNIFINIGFIAVFGLVLFEVIDNYGHLGGLVAGAVYGLIQIPRDPYRDPRSIGGIADAAGFLSLGIFLAICFFTSLYLLKVI